MNGRPLAVAPTCKMCTMCGCPERRPVARCSRRKRSRIVRVKIGDQYLDGNGAVQQWLSAAVHDTETAVPDFLDVIESRLTQFRGDVREQTPLCRKPIDVRPSTLTVLGAGGSNPVGFREHVNPAYQGLRHIPDNGPYPIQSSFFGRGFGTGVRHRGAAVVCQITTNGSYTAPTIET